MKKFVVAALVSLALGLAPAAQAAYSLFLSTSQPAVSTGDEFFVDVNISDNSSALSAFQFVMTFDPAVVSSTGFSFDGTLLGSGNAAGHVDYANFPFGGFLAVNVGSIDFLASSVAGLLDPSPSGVLVTFGFRANAVGSAAFALTNAELGFELAPPLDTATPDLSDALTTVRVVPANQIPEPGSLALTGIAIFVAGVAGRRLARRHAPR